MPRYIDLDKIPHLCGLLNLDDGLLVPIGDVRKALRLAQVEDVAPVIHARWIEADKLLRLRAGDITTEIRGMRAWVDLVELIEFIEKESVEGELSVKDSEEMDLKEEQDAERID